MIALDSAGQIEILEILEIGTASFDELVEKSNKQIHDICASS